MDQLVTPPSDDEKLAFLRNSILTPSVGFTINGEVGLKVTEPEPEKPAEDSYESRPVPLEIQSHDPVAMNQMLGVLNKKRIPYCMVYITTASNSSPVMNFVTTMGGGKEAAELVKHVVDQNKERFGI